MSPAGLYNPCPFPAYMYQEPNCCTAHAAGLRLCQHAEFQYRTVSRSHRWQIHQISRNARQQPETPSEPQPNEPLNRFFPIL